MYKPITLVEVVLIVASAALLAITVIAVLTDYNLAISVVCALAAVVLLQIFVRFNISPDRLRARQSERTLKLAAATLPYMQKGLTEESAQEVCKLLLPATRASSIAITNRERVLGYFGREMESHPVGAVLYTAATLQTLEEGAIQVVRNPEELGIAGEYESMKAAILVPLCERDEVVGVLKLYYRSSRLIDANQQAMAEGLGGLLDMQLRLAELEYQRDLATRMSLKALQAQINPHFLFNTINTIAALIRTDPQRARILLREFAVFYRRTLESSMDDITLDQEITQTLRYLGFEIARFGADRIKIEVEVDEELRSLIVPAFIVQPLVENAVAHAMREDEPLHIRIEAKNVDGEAIIRVCDDGAGMPSDIQERVLYEEGEHASVALKNVADRLEGFFGIHGGLAVQSHLGEGTCIVLNLGSVDNGKVILND